MGSKKSFTGKGISKFVGGLLTGFLFASIGQAACDQTLNPGANVASAVAAAPAGTTICLNSGSYGSVVLGTFTKSPRVIVQSVTALGATMGLQAQNGANGVTFDGIKFTGGGFIAKAATKNITIQNSDFGTSQMVVLTANFNNNNILLDNNKFGAFNANGGWEGRLQVSRGGDPQTVPVAVSGVVVSNNTFGPGGCSDGIQIGAHGVKVGPGNTFTGIRQGSCAAHVDAIQGYGQSSTVIDGNYFYGNTVDVGFYDGGSSETITNNVFGPPGDSAQNLQLNAQGMKMAHNTFRNSILGVGAKFGNAVNSGWIVENNLFVNSDFNAGGDQPGCGSDCIMRYNLKDSQSSTTPSGTNSVLGSPTFVGGSAPTSYAGYQLAAGSLGKNAANDGKDIGINISGTQPPVIAAPSNLRVVSNQYNQVQMAYDYSGSGQSGFQIHRNLGSGSYAQIGTSATLSYSDSSVAASSSYCYQVRAYDATQVSAFSNELCVSTPAGPQDPPVTGESLLASVSPQLLNNNDGVSYELGMKFFSVSNGVIKAIRFYKSPSESGTHTGKIYSSSGALLASVVFSNETASGWQQQALATPLSISANATYVVSVNTGAGFYVDTVEGLASQVSSTNLRSVVGNNGVYGSIGVMPSNSYQNSNYFRDVVFESSASVPAPTIDSLTASPASISSGQSSTLSYSVSGAGQLMLNPGNIDVTGSTSRVVSPTSTTTYTLTATNSTGSVSKSVTVTVAAASQKLFTTQVPAQPVNTDGVNYELGMKFTATVAGKITAIRFYKSSSETGTHVGKIYSSSGALLASVTFSGETASGWQQMNLSTPLSIAANTQYTVSVTTGNTYYVTTVNGLASQVSNGNLKSVVGSNGVFGPVGKRPTSSWNNSNYFRDIVFVPN